MFVKMVFHTCSPFNFYRTPARRWEFVASRGTVMGMVDILLLGRGGEIAGLSGKN